MQNGKLDIGQFGPLGYVFASERAGAEPLASFGTAEGELSSYTGGIWVPKESDITTLEDLRGKDLALGASVRPRVTLCPATPSPRPASPNPSSTSTTPAATPRPCSP